MSYRYEVKMITQFKKDLKLAKKQGKSIDKLLAIDLRNY